MSAVTSLDTKGWSYAKRQYLLKISLISAVILYKYSDGAA